MPGSSTDSAQTLARDTKYCRAIAAYMIRIGHATNAQILVALRTDYPSLSATTVHRATTRLAERGELGIAPADLDGSMRYDANTADHDHFMCNRCGRLRDAELANQVRPLIESQLEGCHISGSITVSGTCKQCTKSKQRRKL